MRIGIDIDGVLTDIEQWQLDYGSKYFFTKYNKGIIKYDEYEVYDIFGAGVKEDVEFWKKYFKTYSKKVAIRPFASEVIDKLIKDGHEIYIITARGSFLSHAPKLMSIEENKEIVINWLKKNKVNYNQIIFASEDKLETCLKNKIDVMIEDKPFNINKLSTKIPVICFNANYNKDIKNNNVYHVYSWYDVYMKIDGIRGK